MGDATVVGGQGCDAWRRQWRLLVAFWQGRPASEVIQLAVDLGEGHMTIGAQRYLLAGCLHNPLSQAFPPIASYITKTLKYAAQAAEADGEECDDSLVEELCARVASGSSPSPSWGHKTYVYGPLEPCNSSAAVVEHHLLIQDVLGRRVQAPRGTCGCGLITLHLSNNMFEGSTGCHEWEAGFLMAEAVLNNPDLFRDVVCTDGDMETVANCRRNLEANGLRVSRDCQISDGQEAKPTEAVASCRQLLWEDGWGCNSPPDVLVGADLLYDPEVIPSLVHLLAMMLNVPAGEDRQAYIATTLRNESTLNSFLSAVRAAGLSIEDATDRLQKGSSIRFVDLRLLADRSRIWVHCIRALGGASTTCNAGVTD